MPETNISDILERIKQLAQQRFQGAKGSHDWEHTERVLTLAAVLHDIGRNEEDQATGVLDHAARGAKLARRI